MTPSHGLIFGTRLRMVISHRHSVVDMQQGAQPLEIADDWTKRAMAFGQIALDASKGVSKLGAAAGRELAKDAAIAGNALIEKLGKTGQNFRGHIDIKGRWDRREGIWHSPSNLAKTFAAVQTELEQISAPEKLQVKTDFFNWTIAVQCAWLEDLPKFTASPHEVSLKLKFTVCPFGTKVDYSWSVDDFPKGLLANRLVRAANKALESTIEATTESHSK